MSPTFYDAALDTAASTGVYFRYLVIHQIILFINSVWSKFD